MCYGKWLENEYKRAREIERKLDLAIEKNRQAAIQVFKALEQSTWKAVGDLERLVKIYGSGC